MNKLILGTVQFGLDYGINNSNGKPQKSKVFDILNFAYKKNITLLDTADAYGNAVDIIGEYHLSTGQKFDIITKFKIENNQPTDIYQNIKASLTRLHTSYIWGYLYHSFSDYKKHPLVLEQLIRAKKEGLIKNIGVSIYTNKDLEEAINDPLIKIIQLPYNLLDNTNQRGALIKKAKALGKIIHTRSTFLQGLFFKDTTTFPEVLRPLSSDIQAIQSLANRHNIKVSSLALKYITDNPDIDNVLIGVDNLIQLQNNMNAVEEKTLPSELLKKIESIHVQNIALLNPSNWS